MGEVINLADPQVFRANLEPTAGKLLTRHLDTAKEWFPHELIPYSLGQTFGKDYEWSPADSLIKTTSELNDEAVRSALYVNLLTEDNLPYYHHDLRRMFGDEGAFGEWNRRWTAEEGRHSLAIRDYLLATRAFDPKRLERGRMAQVGGGETPQPSSPLLGVIYVALQELATRVAHRNTGKLVGDPEGYEVMSRVAADENLHYLFYKDLGQAALEINASQMVIAMEEVVRTFAMPGTGIPEFERAAGLIAASGVYGKAEFHQVLTDVIYKQWHVDKLEGLSPQADQAREAMDRRIGVVSKLAVREQARRERFITASQN